uniref:RAD50-interacting protein 1 n=2 Tax=Lygus hesperus TaxID=30085 RepID=A0A0A9W1K9_LYGHE
MKNVQWPLVSSNNLLASPSADALSKFQHGLKRLLNIAIPAELDSQIVSSTLVVAFPTPTLPVVLLIQPLRKRFLFHFSGNSKTNRIDKPEWYFTQILTWIRDHESFILNWVQPVYDDMDVGKSALAEFMAGLVELSSEKLQVDIEQAQYDDITFSHVVDEALAYERELRHTYLYPQALPGPVHILSQAQLFVKWLSMEKKYAREKMDMMIKSETAWSTLAGDADEDKVTEVAHSFLALLSTMSDRYSLLPQPGHRLQFVELVLEIIDDLRVSLLQVLHSEHNDPLNSKLPQVLNTVHHIRIAIEQYDASPAILLLNHYRTQFNVLSAEDSGNKSRANPLDEPAEGIFQSSLALLGRLESQLLTELCDNLMMEVKAKSRPYRKDKWYGMSEEDVDHSIVTLSGCGMYQALADQLHLVHGKITEKLFSTFWKMVANNICLFFLDEIVLDNYFNAPGGQVLEKDVNKFLIPLFQHYCEVPGTYFAKLQEVCRILALPTLSHSVKRAALCGSGKELLAALDIPLVHLSGEKLCTVITRRVDVVPSLM